MAKDIIHGQVKNALIKDGWIITHDPYRIEYGTQEVQADLAIKRPDDEDVRVVIEIKSFQGRSFISEFEKASGQYRTYRRYMELNNLNHDLYLAASEDIYKSQLVRDEIQVLLEYNEIDLLIIDIEQEEVVQWIS